MEIDTDDGHVAQQVDRSNVDLEDVESQTLAQVFNKFFAAFRLDKFDAVVLYEFRILDLQHLLTEPDGTKKDEVGEDDLEQCGRTGNGIDDRHGDDNKEIGHLAHGHSIGAIAHDREDAKEADTDTHGGFAAQFIETEDHEEHQEENGDTREQEREVEITTMTLAII